MKNNAIAFACFVCALFLMGFFILDGANLLAAQTNVTIEMVRGGLRPWDLSVSTVNAIGVCNWIFWLPLSALMVHIGDQYWSEKI